MSKILLVLLLFYSTPVLFSQQNKPKLLAYIAAFEDAKNKSLDYLEFAKNNLPGLLKNNREAEINKLALEKYIYGLSAEDFASIIQKRTAAYNEDLFAPKMYAGVDFNAFEGILWQKLHVNYYKEGMNFMVYCPLALKIEIIDERCEAYESDPEVIIQRNKVKVKIQDVIKGEAGFKIGDTLEFYYFVGWMYKGCGFEKNESYFVILNPVYNEKKDTKNIAIVGSQIKRMMLKIKDDIVLDEDNYYGFNNISWPEFKTKIITFLKPYTIDDP